MKQPLTVVYVADTRLPTEKAHGLALMKLCEAFARAGTRVEVVAPRLLRLSKKDPYEYYGVKPLFTITRVPSIDLHPLRVARRLLYLVQMVSFSLCAAAYCAWQYRGRTVVYFSHDYMPLYFLSFLGVPVYYDIHHFPGTNFMYRRIMRRAAGFAVQTKWKIDELHRRFGIAKEKIVYWPNGTDVDIFAIEESVAEARHAVGLKAQGPVALYVGQFFAWKGVATLVRALAHMPPAVQLVLVGGTEEDTKQLQKEVPESNNPRILFVPFQKRETVPHWLRAADVLVLPNTGTQAVSKYYTSPMKLFEYLASGRPVVASDLPSIREIVSEDTAYLVAADDPAALARGITHALTDVADAAARAARARVHGARFTWDARAQAILPHLQHCSL